MDLNLYKESLLKELKENILAFWIENTVDDENEGFYGCLHNDLTIDKTAVKGCILNSRILWTYSTAYRVFKEEKYLKMATRAYDYMLKYFWDKENSGIYWSVDYLGQVEDSRKQIYNIAFGIYGLSEYYRATGKEESLSKAKELYELIEKYSYDEVNKGYIEALDKEWNIVADMRLSPKDLNSKKSMNTHLHILEAYTNLLRVWDNKGLRAKLKELIEVTIEHIIHKDNYQFKLFFDEEWNSLEKNISYGHDIEGSWLLYEAAEVLGNKEIIEKSKTIAIKMAEKVLQNGIDKTLGGVYSEQYEDGRFEVKKAWWPQAEGMVGFYNAFQLTGNTEFLEASKNIWDYVDEFFVDKVYGEWFSEVNGDRTPDLKMAKVDPWKCPYHNSRTCFEIIERIDLGGNK